MLAIQGDRIRLIRYKVKVGEITHYAFDDEHKEQLLSKYPNAEVERLDVGAEEFLEGVKCPDIQTAKEWRELGYVPKTEVEQLQEVVDTLIINALGVE